MPVTLEPQRVTEELASSPRYEAVAPELTVLYKELAILEETLTKRGGYLGGWFGRTMPRAQVRLYRARLQDIYSRLELYKRAAGALAAGYDPFTPHPRMFIGYMSGYGWRPMRRRYDGQRRGEGPITETRGGRVLEFNAPMPPDVLEAFERARATGLFKSFLVASHNLEQFRAIEARPAQTRPAWYWLEPILIGTLDQPVRKDPTSGQIGAEHLFLIAQWDLSSEVKLLTSSAPSGS